MENLEIISTQQTVQARQVIAGNTANFSWNFLNGETPSAVNFNIQRGVSGEPTFSGNSIISGAYYSQSQKFDVQNNNFKEGDLELYAQVLATCKEIVAESEPEALRK